MARGMKPPAITEHALQKQVVGHLTAVLKPPVWWSSIDHAGKLSPRQAGDRKRRGVKRGIADIVVMHRHAYGLRVCWIELKRPAGGSVTKEQEDFALAMIRLGTPVTVCRSLEEVDAALDLSGIPRLKIVGARAA